jgi:hypothetical protein
MKRITIVIELAAVGISDIYLLMERLRIRGVIGLLLLVFITCI